MDEVLRKQEDQPKVEFQEELQKEERKALQLYDNEYTIGKVQGEIKAQEEKIDKENKDAEQIVIDEFENLFDHGFEEFDLNQEDEEGEILKQSLNTDFFKNDESLGLEEDFREGEIEKNIEKEGYERIQDIQFYAGNVVDENEVVEDRAEKLKVFQSAPVEKLRTAIRGRYGKALRGSNKNELLLQFCVELGRLQDLNKTKYAGALFDQGGIAFDLLKDYGDRKLLTFLEKKRIEDQKKLFVSYHKLQGEPVPDHYRKKKEGNPRDPETMRQYAAYRVKMSPLYEELQGINRMIDAMQKNMPEDYPEKLGIDSVGEQLSKEHARLLKGSSEEDLATVAEGEALFTEISEETFSLLDEKSLKENETAGAEKFRRWLRSAFEDEEEEDDDSDSFFDEPKNMFADLDKPDEAEEILRDLELPQMAVSKEGMSQKLKEGDVYPPLQENEKFSKSSYRKAELTSRMARLLKMESLVREASKAVKLQNGKQVQGTIVKEYKEEDQRGEVKNKQSLPDALSKGKNLTAAAKKQIAEIVMLNLICGNIVNQEHDLIVEKTKNEDNIVAVREASGTEHSFRETSGKAILKQYGGDGVMSLLSLGNLSEEAKKKILSLNPDVVTELFGEDLKKKEMDALLSRISAVKEMIRTFDRNKIKEQTFAAKKVRKYINAQKERETDKKMASLPEELSGGIVLMKYFQQSISGFVTKDLSRKMEGLSPADQDLIKKAVTGNEETLRRIYMDQVDQYLALSNSRDFVAKLRANDPAAVSVKRDYEERIKAAEIAYRNRMNEEIRALNKCETNEDFMLYAMERKVINERGRYFEEILKSRYKNNEDSDSMLLVKNSVRVLSERALDAKIQGAENLNRALAKLGSQYDFAIQNCRDYITSHKPTFGFWHEDGRKRYEMVQELERRLLREKASIRKNGCRIRERLLTTEGAITNLSELLYGEELSAFRPAFRLQEEEAKQEAENADRPANKEDFVKEHFISIPKAREAVARIRSIKEPEFFDRLKFSNMEELLREKSTYDRVFREMEDAFSVFRDFLLLGGDYVKQSTLGLNRDDIEELLLLRTAFSELKKTVEEVGNAAKELTLHPYHFSMEREDYSGFSEEELQQKEREADGEKKRYLKLLLTIKRNEAKLDSIRTAGGYSDFLTMKKQELAARNQEQKNHPTVRLLKDLVSTMENPAQEKERVEKVLSDLYRGKKLKDTPPGYLVAHLYGKDKEEIRDFLERFVSKDQNVRKDALKEIVERAAKDPSVILHNSAVRPAEMLVNAKYNYGLALRGASLKQAYEDYQKLSPEVPKELQEEAKLKIAIAEKLALNRYEERYAGMVNRILSEKAKEGKDSETFIRTLEKDKKWRESMGLLDASKNYKMEDLAKEKLGSDASPRVMLRYYRQLMVRAHRGKTYLLSGVDHKVTEDFTAEEEKAALQKYQERKKALEKLPEAKEIYNGRYREERKEPEYGEQSFREKWEHFKELKVSDLKMKNVNEIISNAGHNLAIFKEAEEIQQLLTKALLAGVQIPDEELKEADIKLHVIRTADDYTKRIFYLAEQGPFLYMDADEFLSLPAEKMSDIRGNMDRMQDDEALYSFIEIGMKPLISSGLRLSENGIGELEKMIRKKEEKLRAVSGEKIKAAYQAAYGKEIPAQELEKRLRDFEKNKALWSGGEAVLKELFARQLYTQDLVAKYNQEHHTSLSLRRPREFSAYLPYLSAEKQKEFIAKWGQGPEGIVEIVTEMINYLTSADFSPLQESDEKSTFKNFYRLAPLIALLGECEDLLKYLKQGITAKAKAMKSEGKSEAEIDTWIRQKMPSDEVLKKYHAIMKVGMVVGCRWKSFTNDVFASKQKDMEVVHGVITIEDLDKMDHISYQSKHEAGETAHLDKELSAVMYTATSTLSKQVQEENNVKKVTVDFVEKSKTLLQDMEAEKANAPLEEMKKIVYK